MTKRKQGFIRGAVAAELAKKQPAPETAATPATAGDSARIGGNDTANLPNDFGKPARAR